MRRSIRVKSIEERKLSKREMEILRLIASGLENSEVASELGISINTVRSHLKRTYPKLDAENRAHAIHRGHQLGLLEAEG